MGSSFEDMIDVVTQKMIFKEGEQNRISEVRNLVVATILFGTWVLHAHPDILILAHSLPSRSSKQIEAVEQLHFTQEKIIKKIKLICFHR